MLRAHAALGRLVLAAAFVLPAAALGGEAFMRAVMPWLQKTFEVAAPDFRVLDFGMAEVQGERRIAVTATLARITQVGSRTLMPDPRGRAEAFTPLGHAVQGALTALLAAAAWPARSLRQTARRIALVLPLGFGLLLADAPFVLAASLWHLLAAALAPDVFSPLVAWSSFMRGGGRFALALAAAALAVAVEARVFARLRPGVSARLRRHLPKPSRRRGGIAAGMRSPSKR